jgi:amino-acid racemase
VKRIGLLGGMSWESSIEYERLVNEAVRNRLGGLHSADLLIRSYDFAEIEALQSAGEWDRAGELLAADARLLEAAGAEIIVLCTNTMHRLAPQIEAAVDCDFLHIGDVTASAVIEAGVSSVALLGTRHTMEAGFYRDRLTDRGLEVLVPDAADRATVDSVIYDELVRGLRRSESQRRYLEIVERMVSRGAEGVIAGCTEIELLIGPGDLEVPFFPSTRLHAEAAVQTALA